MGGGLVLKEVEEQEEGGREKQTEQRVGGQKWKGEMYRDRGKGTKEDASLWQKQPYTGICLSV